MRIMLLAAASGLAITTSAFAETSQVDELIVTSTRLPSRISDTPGIRVIDRERIEARQAIFAIDVLETVPGLSVFRNGAPGGVTSVRIRGAATDKTLVLVDGVPLNDPSSPNGGFDFGGFDLGDIERVEILSGPQGSLWGSDAIGGVVAFTTRELNGWRAAAEGGSLGTVRGSASAGLVGETWAVGASASGHSNEGISAADEDDGATENDGLSTWAVGVNGRVALTPTLKLDGRARYSTIDVDTDGYAPPFYAFGDAPYSYESQAWSASARVRADDLLGLDHAVSLSLYDIDRTNYGSSASTYVARRETWRWTGEHGGTEDRFSFVLGVERDDTEASVSTGAKSDLGASSAFVVVRAQAREGVVVTGSLRHDAPDEFDAKTTGRIAAAVELPAGFDVSAAFGQGFKTPTISQTFCDFCFPAGLSTGLKPERAEGWDVRLAWASPEERVKADVTGYRLAVRDQISYGVGRYVNLDRTLTHGIEAQATLEISDTLSAELEYAWTDAVDQSTGLSLIRTPTHAGSLSILWSGDRLRGSATFRAEGEQADSDPSTFSRANRQGFATIDLASGWRINDQVELTARVENLMDENYQETLGYGEPGVAVYAGIRLRN